MENGEQVLKREELPDAESSSNSPVRENAPLTSEEAELKKNLESLLKDKEKDLNWLMSNLKFEQTRLKNPDKEGMTEQEIKIEKLKNEIVNIKKQLADLE